MASRKIVAERRQAMVDDIREAGRTGRIRPGDMMPTVRELSEKYELSPQTVSLQLRELADEGVLHTVPRVGVFMSAQVPAVTEPFLMISPPTYLATEPSNSLRLRIGFEERAAQLGVASVSMPLDLALDHRRSGSLPPLAGVLDASLVAPDFRWEPTPETPWVRYATPRSDEPDDEVDRVYLDNHNGGRIATDHLLQQGHSTIAFLGLHHLQTHRQDTEFSVHRAAGWAESMAAAGREVGDLLFTPDVVGDGGGRGSEVALASSAARDLVTRDDITAVVGANDHAVLGLFDQLRRADVAHDKWPAVVGFDGILGLRGQLVTSIRLPWEQLGRAAADMLWDRRTGRLTGPAIRRQIGMTLIPRLSSGRNWNAEGGERMISSLQG